MSILYDPRERSRFFKFAVVGTIGFGVDFLSFNIFRSGIGLSAEISSVLSFCVAVLSNFLFNRFWTYPDSRSKTLISQLVQFSAVNLIGLAIRTIIFSFLHGLLVEMFKIALSSTDFLEFAEMVGENVSLAIVVIIVMFWNFFVNRFWTYNDVD